MLLVLLSPFWIFARLRSWWEILVIAGLLVLWAVVQTFREKLRKYRTKGWPTATGTIANIKIRKVDGGLNGVDYWKVSFDYTYSVSKEQTGSYSFNCVTEAMGNGAVAGLVGKTACVHYNRSKESKGILWEDEVWDIWWDTYWQMSHGDAAATGD